MQGCESGEIRIRTQPGLWEGESGGDALSDLVFLLKL